MKQQIKLLATLVVLSLLFLSCSSIPLADIAQPSPYAMFIALDNPGTLTSPLYYVKGTDIKHIDNGLYGLLLSQDAFVYLRQTAKMDSPDLMYKNLKEDRTVKLISSTQFGTIIGMLISPGRKKLILHIWPDGIATGNNVFVMLDVDNILHNPTKLNIDIIDKGKLYDTIKWVAALGDDGSMVYIGSNGAPDEAIVYRDKDGGEHIIAKYKDNGDFDAIINQGIHPPYKVAYIDSNKGIVYLLGKSGVWTYTPEDGLKLSYPLKSVPAEGLWIDNQSGKLLVWGVKIGKATIKIYSLDGTLQTTASNIYLSDPRIVGGKLFGIGAVKDKTIYSYTIGEVTISTASVNITKIFISQDDIKWWDITANQ